MSERGPIVKPGHTLRDEIDSVIHDIDAALEETTPKKGTRKSQVRK